LPPLYLTYGYGPEIRAFAIATHKLEFVCCVGDRWKARCRRGVVVSGVRRMNEVNARRARLVLGWVTVFGRVYHLGM